MSGFSAFTFTGMAGIAYKDGLIAVATYIGNACTFLLGYWVFASRWRRARISSTMEYLSERFDDRSRRLFSVATVFFQIFMGSSMLFGVGLFVASVSGLSPDCDDFGRRHHRARLLHARRPLGGRRG